MPCEDITKNIILAMAGSDDAEDSIEECYQFIKGDVTRIREQIALARASVKEPHSIPSELRKRGVDQADLVKVAVFEMLRRVRRSLGQGDEFEFGKLKGRIFGGDESFLVIAFCEGCEGFRAEKLKSSFGYFVQEGEVVVAEVYMGKRDDVIRELSQLA